MFGFLCILAWTARRRGIKKAWARLKLGIEGFSNPFCVSCGEWKGRTSAVKCEPCVLGPLTRVISEVLQAV